MRELGRGRLADEVPVCRKSVFFFGFVVSIRFVEHLGA